MSSSSGRGSLNKENVFFGAWPKELSDKTSNTPAEQTEQSNSANYCNYRVRSKGPRLRENSKLDLILENPQQEAMHDVKCTHMARSVTKETTKVVRNIVLFVPNLFVKFTWSIIRYILYIPLSIAAPSFWLSALLWIFWKVLRFPVSLIKWLSNSSGIGKVTNTSPRTSVPKPERTILISCGSTIQTLHLARNFYSSGTRVVVFEFDGLFGLARFSTSVDKFYIVPRPTANNPSCYVNALCQIVKKEKPLAYIPVCVTSPAYYDALAKPHLELLGCSTFIPGVQETKLLDDCMEFFQKCSTHDIQLPPHSVLRSLDELMHLYARGFISNFQNILIAVGMNGLLTRYKYILPNNSQEFKFNHKISEQHQWLLVRDLPGEHYITCTTVKDSQVVANITCRVEHDTKNLVPVIAANTDKGKPAEELEIQIWLKTFFHKVRFQRNINGHISFRFVRCQGSRKLLPLGIRLGVSLPYICYSRSHAQILCRTMKCAHMMQVSSCQDDESLLAALSINWRWTSSEKTAIEVALDKREALFAYWDPLPYCAFYHFQLPLESVKSFLQKKHRSAKTISPCIAMPVH